ncbi:MAG TPA: sigma-70 family RNA polymerase sigma factor, partial [Planctomycetota bacterium]|nr:sigma-70 family RNA polymerase sigma factor [Planctomycetota bacterium]
RYRRFSTPSGAASLREEVERVESAFDRLSDEHREVITLAHLTGLSRSEIAERMQRSEGAVRVLLHRALARLSGLLQPGSEG